MSPEGAGGSVSRQATLCTVRSPTDGREEFRISPQCLQKIDTNGDGLLSKDEMMSAQSDRIDKIFINFDKNSDGKLSKKELRALRYELRKRINKFRNEEK